MPNKPSKFATQIRGLAEAPIGLRPTTQVSELVGNEEDVTDLDPRVIKPNPRQPRQYRDVGQQAELTASVEEYGVLEPVIVRNIGARSDRPVYELVAGSSRLAAALEVGLRQIPVVVRDYDDDKAELVALLENLQRNDLRIDDECAALSRLKSHYGTNESVAKLLGKSTDYVEIRIAAAENPAALAAYMRGEIRLRDIRGYVSSTSIQPNADPIRADHSPTRQVQPAQQDEPTRQPGVRQQSYWGNSWAKRVDKGELAPPSTADQRADIRRVRDFLNELLGEQ